MADPAPGDDSRGGVLIDDRDRTDTAHATGLFRTALGVLRAPSTTFRVIADREPVVHAVAVVVAVAVLMAVVQAFGVIADPDTAAQSALAAFLGGLFIGLPMGLIFFIVWVAAVLLGARLFGGNGTFRGTLSGLGFAYAPLVFGGLIAVLALPFGPAAGGIVVVAFLATTLWSFVLDVVAVRQVHDLRTGRAIGAVLLPIAAFGVLVVLLLGALLAALLTAA